MPASLANYPLNQRQETVRRVTAGLPRIAAGVANEKSNHVQPLRKTSIKSTRPARKRDPSMYPSDNETTPSIVQNVIRTVSDLTLNPDKGKGLLKGPLQSTGSLDSFPHEDLTPSTGTEFTSATQLSAILKDPD